MKRALLPAFYAGFLRLYVLLACVALLAGLPRASFGAALSLSPGTISNLYAGSITVQVTGLTNGETVLLERFLDINGNGAIDAGEPLLGSYRLTDGQVVAFGGVRNGNIPGDDDLVANGQITSAIDFAHGPEFSRGVGNQLFRLSSPGGRFSPAQQPLLVTQAALPFQISGTISNASGPLPYGIVAALVQIGNDQEFVAGAVADATGHFSLGVTNGTYLVVGFKAGHVGNFGASPMVTLSGANTNVSVMLTAANLSLSGSVLDSGSGSPVPGVQCFVTSANNDFTVMFSDGLGNFSASLISGQWQIEPSDFSLLTAGCLRQGKPQVAVSTANVTGLLVPVTRGTALIYGTLKDTLGNPLPNVRISAGDSGNIYQTSGFTSAGGQYFVQVTNGTWYVGADSQGSGLPSGYALQQAQVTIGNGQAVLVNLVARQATAWLAGRAVDSNNNPIGSGSIMAFAGNNVNVQAQLANDGSFALPVWGGTWTVSLETVNAASHNVVSPQISFAVTDGSSISNINYVAPLATRSISGWVRNSTNAGLSSLNLFAGAYINGTNYNAGANTDGSGNYSMPVLAGIWNIGVDSQALQQRGYGSVPNQNTDTSSGNQTVNFLVGGPPVGELFFRQALGIVGDFGTAATPTVTYPVNIRNYRAIFHVFNDPTPPTADTVLFTGPPGSGLTNTPADPTFGAVTDGTNVYYFSPQVRQVASGGNWTVMYRSNPNFLSIPDPQSGSRVVVPLPTVNVSGDVLYGLTWAYQSQNGNPMSGIPAFVRTNRLDLLDQNGNLLDAVAFPATLSYTYPSTNRFHWSNLGAVRVSYYDDLGNQYFVAFSESNPSLTSAARVSGQSCQFVLNAPPGVNYTVQYRTNLLLGAWNPLLVTNFPASPVTITDPGATNLMRFYRVLVGP